MSLTSRLNLGNLRRHRLAIFLVVAIVLFGAAIRWRSQAAAVAFEEPMARYYRDSIVEQWIVRPDGHGALKLFRDSSSVVTDVESYDRSLVDVTQMTAPMPTDVFMATPYRCEKLLEDSNCRFAIYSPASDRIAVADRADLHIFDATTNAKLVRLAPPPVRVKQAAFSRDGKWLAAAHVGKEVFLWNLAEPIGLRMLPIPETAYVTFGANADEMLVIKKATDCEIWSLTTLQPIGALPPIATASYSAGAVSQHGDRLAIGASDGTIGVWKLADRALETRINAFPAPLLDKMQICFAGSDDSLVAIRPLFRRELWPLSSFPFLRFVSIARTSEFRVWSVRDWRLRHSWQNTCSDAIYPDGHRLAFADLSGDQLRLWSLRPPGSKE